MVRWDLWYLPGSIERSSKPSESSISAESNSWSTLVDRVSRMQRTSLNSGSGSSIIRRWAMRRRPSQREKAEPVGRWIKLDPAGERCIVGIKGGGKDAE